jgi:hypothetical protein
VRIDVHQHLWPEALLEALADRHEAPFVLHRDSGWELHAPGEAPSALDALYWDVEARRDLVEADGVDRALVCLSSPLGIESLPRSEAEPLLEAYHRGVAELPAAFGAWGAVAIDAPDPADVDALLDDGFVGVSLPAAALADPSGLDSCGPLLERLEGRGAPLLVHPGPVPWRDPGRVDPLAPDWWPALTRYVEQMSAAWHAFLALGRPAHPGLRVLFTMLGGLGPLHAERLAARTGHTGCLDSNAFMDASSYGPRALDAMVRAVGVDQLVYGSDRPVVDARPLPEGDALREAMLTTNPDRLLAGNRVPA